MSEPEDRPLRPQPARPEFAVEPLRSRPERSGTDVAVRVARWSWTAVTAVALGLAAVVALEYDAVRTTVEDTVTASGATAEEVADTATVTLLGSGAVGAVVLLIGWLGLSLASSRRAVSGGTVLVAGLAAIGAFVLFWSFMSGSGSIAAGVLRWGPFVGVGLAVVTTAAAALGLVSTRE